MRESTGVFPYGIYLGRNEQRVDVPGFSVSLLRPILRAEEVGLHTHPQASFVLVLSGAYISSADGAEPVSRGPVLIFNPAGTTHRDSFLVPSGRFLTISIPDQIVAIAEKESELPRTAVAYSSSEILQTAIELAAQCAGASPDRLSVMEDMCWTLLAAATETGRRKKQDRQARPALAMRARDLMHDRSVEPLCVTEVAREIGVHPVYFARMFRRTFSCTPAEYRTRCRLQNAMALLRRTDMPLPAIATTCGFFDQSHFSTAFLRHFGHAPGGYRRNLRQHQSASEV